MKSILLFSLLVASMAGADARAGGAYECPGSGGVRSFGDRMACPREAIEIAGLAVSVPTAMPRPVRAARTVEHTAFQCRQGHLTWYRFGACRPSRTEHGNLRETAIPFALACAEITAPLAASRAGHALDDQLPPGRDPRSCAWARDP